MSSKKGFIKKFKRGYNLDKKGNIVYIGNFIYRYKLLRTTKRKHKINYESEN